MTYNCGNDDEDDGLGDDDDESNVPTHNLQGWVSYTSCHLCQCVNEHSLYP